MNPLRFGMIRDKDEDLLARASNNRPAWLSGPIRKLVGHKVYAVCGFLAARVREAVTIGCYTAVGFEASLLPAPKERRPKTKTDNKGRTYCREFMKGIGRLGRSSPRICVKCGYKIHGKNHEEGSHHLKGRS